MELAQTADPNVFKIIFSLSNAVCASGSPPGENKSNLATSAKRGGLTSRVCGTRDKTRYGRAVRLALPQCAFIREQKKNCNENSDQAVIVNAVTTYL
jgi:hypothetical protein